MRLGSCPDDVTLESFLYNDLPAAKNLLVRIHLASCAGCRTRLEGLKAFDNALSSIPPEEPPQGFEEQLLSMVNSWPDLSPTQDAGAIRETIDPVQPPWRKLSLKWGLAAAIYAVSGLVQWQFGDMLPGLERVGLFGSVADMRSVWQFIVSGQMWQSFQAIIAAVRTDGISALEIVGSTLPTGFTSVLVFSGTVLAVLIVEIRSVRSGGDR